jgi:hypothetical protein
LISESMRLSTLLHVFTPWRGLAPDGSITINHLLHQLISCLKLILSAPNWSPNMIMLWMFCTGAVAADKLPERGCKQHWVFVLVHPDLQFYLMPSNLLHTLPKEEIRLPKPSWLG